MEHLNFPLFCMATATSPRTFNFSPGIDRMLVIDGISKNFKGRQALHPLSLEVRAGEIFGLLRHNGAGKSTTFGMVLGHIRPDSGEVRIAGASVFEYRAPWETMLVSYTWLMALNASLLVLAWLAFDRRDFKS